MYSGPNAHKKDRRRVIAHYDAGPHLPMVAAWSRAGAVATRLPRRWTSRNPCRVSRHRSRRSPSLAASLCFSEPSRLQPCNQASSYPAMTHQIIETLCNRAIDCGTPIYHVLEKAGVNESTWWRWKTGKASPTLSTLQRSGRVLDEIEAEAKARA